MSEEEKNWFPSSKTLQEQINQMVSATMLKRNGTSAIHSCSWRIPNTEDPISRNPRSVNTNWLNRGRFLALTKKQYFFLIKHRAEIHCNTIKYIHDSPGLPVFPCRSMIATQWTLIYEAGDIWHSKSTKRTKSNYLLLGWVSHIGSWTHTAKVIARGRWMCAWKPEVILWQ